MSGILIIAGDPATRGTLSRALTYAGFSTVTAACPVEGERCLHTHADKVLLVIMDLTEVDVEVDRWELASHLAAQYPRERVLYLSNGISSIAADAIRSAQPEAILERPFTDEQLLERVHLLTRS